MDKQEIKNKMREALESCPHRESIKSLAIFGSHVHGGAREDSDIDVLIDFEPEAVIGFFALSDIKDTFESFLKRSVDLLTPQAISKYFRAEVLAEAEYIYEK
jgi:predicted nucleotidyltransferase